MAHIQYARNVIWDVNLIDAGFDEKGLVINGEYNLAGAPASHAGRYQVACIIQNIADGNVYVMNGTTAAPTWFALPSTASITTKVHLTSAQILALNGTPIQLLPAPAAGTVYQVLAVMGRMNFLTAAYATHTALDVTDATSGDILFSDSATLLAATSTKVATLIPNANSGAGVVVTAAGAINAAVATGNPATGAGSLDLYLTYKIVTL